MRHIFPDQPPSIPDRTAGCGEFVKQAEAEESMKEDTICAKCVNRLMEEHNQLVTAFFGGKEN